MTIWLGDTLANVHNVRDLKAKLRAPKCEMLADICYQTIIGALRLGNGMPPSLALGEAARLSPERAKPVLKLLAQGNVEGATLSLLDFMPDVGIMEALELSDNWKGTRLQELKASAKAAIAELSMGETPQAPTSQHISDI